MPKLSPQEARDKWSRRMKAAGTDVVSGVNRVKEAPGAKAAAKADKMRTRLMDALDSGKWKERVASVPLEEWRKKMLDKGVGRISAGVDGAAPKMDNFFTQLFDHQERLQGQIANLPDVTIEDSLNRVTTWIRGMSTFKRR